MHRHALIASLGIALLVSGCATLGYYAQAVGGHFDLLARARPIDELIEAPDTDAALRERLRYTLRAREFATRELGLPANESYRRYAALDGPFVVWNVFAAPEFSLEPRQWCFPVAGCVAYRGFFARERAEAFAAELRAEGLEVFVGGVAAYSTLGWFDDPVTSSMLARPLPELAGLVFHELAHQQLYVPDDTVFNESFAVAVEIEGVRRWLAHGTDDDGLARYLERRTQRDAFVQLALDTRARLEQLYASTLADSDKRARKQALLGEFWQTHDALKARVGGGLDAWRGTLNNAHLVSVGLYHRHAAAFGALLQRHGGDLGGFYAEVRALAALPPEERAARLLAAAAP